MSQIKPEDIKGVVRTEVHKGDEGREKPYVAVMNDGRQVRLDTSEAKSLQKRLDKDRSRMEKDGVREQEREPEKRERNRVASEADKRAFLEQFKRSSRS